MTREERFAKQFGSAERVEWLHRQLCVVCKHRRADHAHHVRSRGAGGTADDLVPVCCGCHDLIHRKGRRTVEKQFGVDLTAEAAAMAGRWKSHVSEPGISFPSVASSPGPFKLSWAVLPGGIYVDLTDEAA